MCKNMRIIQDRVTLLRVENLLVVTKMWHTFNVFDASHSLGTKRKKIWLNINLAISILSAQVIRNDHS